MALNPATGKIRLVISRSLTATFIKYGVQQLYSLRRKTITRMVNVFPITPENNICNKNMTLKQLWITYNGHQ